jgi:hypothetical protein
MLGKRVGFSNISFTFLNPPFCLGRRYVMVVSAKFGKFNDIDEMVRRRGPDVKHGQKLTVSLEQR